jgi:hypothetical protein
MNIILSFAVVSNEEEICTDMLYRWEGAHADMPPIPAVGANYMTDTHPASSYTVTGHYWRHKQNDNIAQIVVSMKEDE